MPHTKLSAAALVVALSALQAPVLASGSHEGGHDDEPNIGVQGTADHVDRTIEVEMGEMFFSPNEIEVKKGETIRFVVTNAGEFVHEFSIGTEEMHIDHMSEMMMMMDGGVLEADHINHAMMGASEMAHDDANSVLLEPGKTAEVIWTFSGDALLELSCNVPGHRESGMLGNVRMMGDGS